MQNRISIDLASDSSSLDSLSFAGLVCIQDQQSKSPTDIVYQNNKDDQEFEFVSGTQSRSPQNLQKNCNGHLLPLEFLLKSRQSQATNEQDYKQSRTASLSSSKTPMDNHVNHTKVSNRSNQKVKNQVKKESTAPRSSFGLKLFHSFVSPCRECSAASPTIKAHTVPQESVKLR
ncbi:hypothetical protein COLO4_31435 [Corchorus olitorius]|uniref:Uncharacterized protein n=1 Tax=Corchorus olitorius TaxID=93759 RepID=A0A1R3H4D2_9ROSI|nr:hypothetical protein COLO4_31435 [Corchorus olitorius]